ncbi:hypothetical protein ACS2BO_27045 [Bacillus cereus group sp. BceL305]|uniref:hypothetical protein n=1 Tax=unclassified Bacillus cereus group TaxID=2750818 RepID=UPI0022E6BE6F|nr:hypothetical protein [Bacillus cereus group sp. BY142LC]MDA1834765.1 hypothetical protein [Bacillus cereus group sp. BY142LC]
MRELSKAQLEIVLLMHHKGYSLVCNEGANYKCWLEDEQRNKVQFTIKRNTGDSLYSKGWITSDLSVADLSRRFHHKLTDKAIRKLGYWYESSKKKQELDSTLNYVLNKIVNKTK